MAMWCRSATSMAISSRTEPPGWMMAVTPRSPASWMASANGKYASEASADSAARSDGPVEGDLDRRQPAGLTRTHTHERTVAGQHDRVAGHMPDRAPREQQVGELLEGRPPTGHHVQLGVIEQCPVLGLHQDPAVDALQVQVGDAPRPDARIDEAWRRPPAASAPGAWRAPAGRRPRSPVPRAPRRR